jgi:hypothetical protein
MTWREMVGWGLVASASICDTLAALVKCGAFEAPPKRTERIVCDATAPVLSLPGPLREGGFVGTCYLRRLRNNPRRHSLTQPTRNTLQMFRGQNLTELCLWITSPKNRALGLARALGKIGAPAVPLLVDMLGSDQEWVAECLRTWDRSPFQPRQFCVRSSTCGRSHLILFRFF